MEPRVISATLDVLARRWWRAWGREVDLEGEHAWLAAPTMKGSVVKDGWLRDAAAGYGGKLREGPGTGLIEDFSALDGPGFRAAELAPAVRSFYEHTADWRMEVWTGWSPVFWPGGELISRLFGRRVGQLALPMRPLDVARGMDSRVVVIADADGRQRAAAWLRTLRSTGEYVYSGCYGYRMLPSADRPSVHVAFPLELGNVQVFLRPDVAANGALRLTSTKGEFGGDGAYTVVEVDGVNYAARVPIHEEFHVYVDDEGVLRTDHELRLWAADVVRLHYRLEPRE
jgi:hypothetical protein